MLRRTPILAVLFAILLAAPAGAAVPHVVQPGETLWSIAAANNLTTRTVAAFNGLSEGSQVVLGSTIQVPSTVEGYAALQKAGLVAAAPRRRLRPPPPLPARRRRAAAPPPPAPLGGYTVRPGDTLSGLAAGARVSVNAIAAMNGLEPVRRAARRHRDQAADRRARARPRLAARSGREGRPGRRARAHRFARRRRRRAVGRRRPRRLPLAGDRDRLAGERLQQRDGLVAPTPAASCRSCRARGTTCSRTSPRASSTRTPPRTT